MAIGPMKPRRYRLFVSIAIGAILSSAGCASRSTPDGALWSRPLGGAKPPGRRRPSPEAPVSPSPVELHCERGLGVSSTVSLRNRSRRALDVDLLGYAYAGRGMWDHWWTQHGIHLSPRGSWSAVIDEVRLEKLEV